MIELSRRRALRVSLLSVFCAALLAGCGGESAPATGPVAAPTTDAVEAPAAEPVNQGPDVSKSLAKQAAQALREQRTLAPAGDNAFEFYVQAVEADTANGLARTALDDLVPYAVLRVEQRVAARDLEESARVLALIERASPQAPALPRLQRAVAELVQAAERETAAAARAAAAPAPAAARPAEPETVAAPAPAATSPSPPPPVAVAPAEPAPAPANSPAPASPAVVAPRPARIPEVVFRPPLRYPSLAERRRLEGFVELEFTIGADGSVSDVEVLRAEPPGVFEREAIGAMQRWRFAPPGAPMRASRVLEFKLAR